MSNTASAGVGTGTSAGHPQPFAQPSAPVLAPAVRLHVEDAARRHHLRSVAVPARRVSLSAHHDPRLRTCPHDLPVTGPARFAQEQQEQQVLARGDVPAGLTLDAPAWRRQRWLRSSR